MGRSENIMDQPVESDDEGYYDEPPFVKGRFNGTKGYCPFSFKVGFIRQMEGHWDISHLVRHKIERCDLLPLKVAIIEQHIVSILLDRTVWNRKLSNQDTRKPWKAIGSTTGAQRKIIVPIKCTNEIQYSVIQGHNY